MRTVSSALPPLLLALESDSKMQGVPPPRLPTLLKTPAQSDLSYVSDQVGGAVGSFVACVVKGVVPGAFFVICCSALIYLCCTTSCSAWNDHCSVCVLCSA